MKFCLKNNNKILIEIRNSNKNKISKIKKNLIEKTKKKI